MLGIQLPPRSSDVLNANIKHNAFDFESRSAAICLCLVPTWNWCRSSSICDHFKPNTRDLRCGLRRRWSGGPRASGCASYVMIYYLIPYLKVYSQWLTYLGASPVTSKLKVALVESQDLRKARSWSLDSSQFSNRVSSLTPSTVEFLQRIGAWEHLDVERVQNYQDMQVWDGETGSRISFDWSMETSPFEEMRTVATMTENANLVRGLLHELRLPVMRISSCSPIPPLPQLKMAPISRPKDLIYPPGPFYPLRQLHKVHSRNLQPELPRDFSLELMGLTVRSAPSPISALKDGTTIDTASSQPSLWATQRNLLSLPIHVQPTSDSYPHLEGPLPCSLTKQPRYLGLVNDPRERGVSQISLDPSFLGHGQCCFPPLHDRP